MPNEIIFPETSDPIRFLEKALSPSSYNSFTNELRSREHERQHQSMVEMHNAFETLKFENFGGKPRYRAEPELKIKSTEKQITEKYFKTCDLETLKKTWGSSKPSIVARAYAYLPTEHEYTSFILSVARRTHQISEYCKEAFPESNAFDASYDLIYENEKSGVESETNKNYRTLDIFCNGIKFQIFIIEYFSSLPELKSNQKTATSNNIFTLDNHPFREIKNDIIQNKNSKSHEAPKNSAAPGLFFWYCIFFAFITLIIIASST